MADTVVQTRLAAVMARRGISQVALARRARVARQTVVDAYYGRSHPTIETWIRLAEVLRVPLKSLAPDAAAALENLPARPRRMEA